MQKVSRSPRRTIVGRTALLSTLALAAILAACSDDSDDDRPAAAAQSQLYTVTNESANAVVHFTRKADGTLIRAESTSTGGAGTNAVGADGTTAPSTTVAPGLTMPAPC